tara:strand:- start:385 stop:618 length:234 start_codon:yes stop_codon:yes gene_type:complete
MGTYAVGETVIISIFETLKVGTVIEQTVVKVGQRYIVQTEDGKVYTDVYVNFKDGVDAYINIQLTKSFLNKQKNTDG